MSGSVSPGPTVTQSLDWLGTIRGRVGYAMGAWMPYVTGGFAFGGGTRTTNIGSQSATATHTGYVLGAGVEYAFSPQWTAKLEYQYLNLGGSTLHIHGTAVPQRRHHGQHRPRRPELQILTPDLGSFGKPRHHCRGFLLGRTRYLDTVFASA